MTLKETKVYFIYSKEQLELRRNLAKKTGRTFIPGTVTVRGANQIYTEILDNLPSRFSDSVVVAIGNIGSFNYKESVIE